jgi:hypothetical protein
MRLQLSFIFMSASILLLTAEKVLHIQKLGFHSQQQKNRAFGLLDCLWLAKNILFYVFLKACVNPSSKRQNLEKMS